MPHRTCCVGSNLIGLKSGENSWLPPRPHTGRLAAIHETPTPNALLTSLALIRALPSKVM